MIYCQDCQHSGDNAFAPQRYCFHRESIEKENPVERKAQSCQTMRGEFGLCGPKASLFSRERGFFESLINLFFNLKRDT